MRKCYVLTGWNKNSQLWIIGVYTSLKRALRDKIILEYNKEFGTYYDIQTEVLK